MPELSGEFLPERVEEVVEEVVEGEVVSGQEIVINDCFGGFGISQEAAQRLVEMGVPAEAVSGYSLDEEVVKRDDRRLVQVVRELGRRADGAYARLVVVTIPDGVEWSIGEYDGTEWVEERHRNWYA